MIEIRNDERLFHLATEHTSYVVEIASGVVPTLRHWGPRIGTPEAAGPRGEMPYRIHASASLGALQLEGLPVEYGTHGEGDFRRPAVSARDGAGYPVTTPVYRGYRVRGGKPPLDGLPSARLTAETGSDTLELELIDEAAGLLIVLDYTVHADWDVITRHARLENTGREPLSVERFMSASVDLPARPVDTVTLSGSWGRERHLARSPLGPGIFAGESTRGTSSHVANPFIALAARDAGEDRGEVHAATLVYSGNFLAEVDASLEEFHRLSLGINPSGFSWRLEPGESLTSPEAILVYSREGLDGMSRRFHRTIQEGIVPQQWARAQRPVLLNSWEAQYFDITEDNFLSLTDAAAELGVELAVLDDGWFGERDGDAGSLGDWYENTEKLPSGVDGLGEYVHARGLGFGLWVEPEMISPASRLYEEHPEWCLHIPGRPDGTGATLGRNQLVLDLTREDVQDRLIATFSRLFARAGLDYVKWDMNRYLAPIASAALPPERRGEAAHRYVLGLYRVLAELRDRFPAVLFESCAGGGGRFDAGMLAYMPQTWTSDNTDAVSRLYIQYGTSMVYPPVTMGAHVSAAPNHQLGRNTPVATRAAVAMSANFGFEMDLREIPAEEREVLRGAIAFYRRHRQLIQQGRFLRLESPFEGNRAAWMFSGDAVSGGAAPGDAPGPTAGHARADGSPDALVFVFRVLIGMSPHEAPVRLRGLDPEAVYEVYVAGPRFACEAPPVATAGGDELCTRGLEPALPRGDYASAVYCLYRRADTP
ncbi:MAG: alpha-galactosidase [Spirochaetia bacterium]